jgi:hypothetical protein
MEERQSERARNPGRRKKVYSLLSYLSASGWILSLALIFSPPPTIAKPVSPADSRGIVDGTLFRNSLLAQGVSSEGKRSPAAKSIPRAKILTDINIITRTDVVTVELKADGQIPEGQSFRLDDPPRWVIDFPDLSNGTAKKRLYVGHRHLKEVRIGQHEDKVRVVFTFPEQKAPPLDMAKNGPQLRITFGFASPAEIIEKKPPTPLAKGEPPPPAEKPALPVPPPPSGKKEETAEPKPTKATLPPETRVKASPSQPEGKPAVPVEKPVVSAKEPPAESKSQKVEPKPAKVPSPSEQEALVPAKEPAAEAKAQRNAIKSVPPYRGERVSLDFRDADLRQVFQLIVQVSKRQIILSDDIRDRITVRLLDIPWDEALDIILEHKNLRKFEEGNLIRIGRNSP